MKFLKARDIRKSHHIRKDNFAQFNSLLLIWTEEIRFRSITVNKILDCPFFMPIKVNGSDSFPIAGFSK
jgi:hypothetical protein